MGCGDVGGHDAIARMSGVTFLPGGGLAVGGERAARGGNAHQRQIEPAAHRHFAHRLRVEFDAARGQLLQLGQQCAPQLQSLCVVAGRGLQRHAGFDQVRRPAGGQRGPLPQRVIARGIERGFGLGQGCGDAPGLRRLRACQLHLDFEQSAFQRLCSVGRGR